MLGVIMVALPLGHLFTAALADQPTVVELFTSEGCSKSPAADALLSELAGRPDVLALSFHVTYWNRMGWTDPFATEANTRRQRHYNEVLGRDSVYTPQMIVDGSRQVAGNRPRAIGEAVAASREAASARRLNSRLNIGMEARDGTLNIAIPRGARLPTAMVAARPACCWSATNCGAASRSRPEKTGASACATATWCASLWIWVPGTAPPGRFRCRWRPLATESPCWCRNSTPKAGPATILGAARVERRLLGVWVSPWEAMVRMMRAVARRVTGGDGAAPL